MKFPEVLLVMARPVWLALFFELLTPMSVRDGSKCDQPWMVPSSVENKKSDVQLSIWNSLEPL